MTVWALLQNAVVAKPALPGSPQLGPLLFRGLRVRMGLHSGAQTITGVQQLPVFPFLPSVVSPCMVPCQGVHHDTSACDALWQGYRRMLMPASTPVLAEYNIVARRLFWLTQCATWGMEVWC